MCGVLSVDVGVVFFAVLVGVGKGDVDAVSSKVYYVVDGGGCHVVVEQVFKSVAADDAPVVLVDGKPSVEIGVVAEHELYILCPELEVFELLGVWLKIDVGTVFFLSVA